MKNIFIALVLLLVGCDVLAQTNTLYHEIQEAKQSNIEFKYISVFNEAKADKRISNEFINPNEVAFFELKSKSSETNDQAINMVIPYNAQNITLELIKVPEVYMDYEVVTSDGKTMPANRDIKHYRGVIRGIENSLAAITIYDNEIMGLIISDEGNFNLVKDKQSGKHIFYNDKNVKEKPSLECGTEDEGNTEEYSSEILFQQRDMIRQNIMTAQALTNAVNIVKFYFETEYDIYQAIGSTAGVEAFISGLFNQVAVLYQNENIITAISQLYVWTSADPYTATSTSNLLSQFQSTRTSFTGNLGMLLTFRYNSNGEKGGLAAGFSGLCNSSTSQKLAVAMIYEFYSIVPAYSWSVYVITHEFGHLLGSKHTKACVWNGNNTAIDGCGDIEGSCSNPGYPASGGTIMSYCHLIPSVGINFSLGFGSQPGNVIRNSVANSSCLTKITISGLSAICSGASATYTVNNAPSGFTWSCSSNLTLTSTSGNTATFSNNNTGNAWVSIKVGNIDIVKYNVWLGEPAIPEITDIRHTTTNGSIATYSFLAGNLTSGHTPYSSEWKVSGLLSSIEFSNGFPEGSYTFTNVSTTPTTCYAKVALNIINR
ncbi:MAG: zinc-dependent metalloprotease [Prevotellaceae bacterium]|jgi:hypothetical protein|nr:zinc-dependent metalloprotease [Prevotellaceae bacterium]